MWPLSARSKKNQEEAFILPAQPLALYRTHLAYTQQQSNQIKSHSSLLQPRLANPISSGLKSQLAILHFPSVCLSRSKILVADLGTLWITTPAAQRACSNTAAVDAWLKVNPRYVQCADDDDDDHPPFLLEKESAFLQSSRSMVVLTSYWWGRVESYSRKK
jgi:hypothetical protein